MSYSLARKCVIFAAAVTILALAICMARTAAFNSHPDELYHVTAAKYYITNWDIPKVGDPRTFESYSQYGVSYLHQLDPVYFFAGKFARLALLFTDRDYLALRYFNVCLLGLLLALFFLTPHKRRIAFLPLFVTPQVWYIFSYFNGDAFPFFLIFLVVYLAANHDYSLNIDLRSPTADDLHKTLFLCLLLALIMLSKLNYHIFVVFVFSLLLLDSFFKRNLKTTLINCSIILLVSSAIFGARLAYDHYLNGFKKDEAVIVNAEKYATPEFKPSSMSSGKTYEGVSLKSRGAPLSELFTKWEWDINIYRSFIGVYGHMKIFAKFAYYAVFKYFGILLLFFLLFPIALQGRQGLYSVSLLIVFVLLTLGQALYHSWVNDFQSQGRYLFPALGMLGILLARYSRYEPEVRFCIDLASITLFGFSVWSFVYLGLANIPR